VPSAVELSLQNLQANPEADIYCNKISISNLSSVSKLLERSVASQMSAYFSYNDLFPPLQSACRKVKKVKVGFFYSATYTGNAATSRAVQPQEVAVDWQEPMVLQRNAAATTHTTAPNNHTRPSPRKHSPDVATRARKESSDYSLLLSLSTSKE